MKRLAFILAALMCGSAYADLIARNGANEIRLQEGTCSNDGDRVVLPQATFGISPGA